MPVLKRRLLNEGTEVPAARSVSEISMRLVEIGAVQVATRYSNGRVTGLSWAMPVHGAEAHFTMPARVEAVHKILRQRLSGLVTPERDRQLKEKAERIAWRHLLRWVEAQVAMVQTTMMEPAEPFVPFATFANGDETLYQHFAETARLLAEAQ